MAARKSKKTPPAPKPEAQRKAVEKTPVLEKNTTTEPESAPPPENPNWIDDWLALLPTKRLVQIVLALAVLFYLFMSITQRQDIRQRKADWAYTNDNWNKAARNYGKLLKDTDFTKASANQVDSQLNRAHSLLEIGKLEQAVSALDRLEPRFDQAEDSALALRFQTLRGWALLEQKRAEEGRQLLRAAFDKDTDNLMAAGLLLKDALARDALREAVPYFEAVRESAAHADSAEEYRRRVRENFLQVPEEKLAGVPEQLPTEADTTAQ